MAGPTSGSTVSLNQDQVLKMHDQVLGLAMVIGMPPPPNGEYDAAYGQMLNGAITDLVNANKRYVVPNPEDDAYNTIAQRIYMGLPPEFADSFGLENAADVKELLQNVDEYTLTLNQLKASGVDFAALSQQQGNTQSQPQMRTETRTQPSREVADDVKVRVQRVETALKNAADSIDGISASSIGTIDGILDSKSFSAYQTALSYMAGQAGLSDELAAQGGNYTPAFGQQLKTALDAKLDLALSPGGRLLLDEDQIKGYEALKRSLPQLVSDLNYLHGKDELRPVTMETVTVQVPVDAPQDNAPASNQNNGNQNNDNQGGNEGGNNADDGQPEQTNQGNQPEQSVRTLSAEVIADNKLIQETLRDALTSQGMSTEGKLRTDGQWDQSSLSMLNAVVDMIKGQTGLNTGDFSASGYVSGLGDAIKQKIASDDALKAQVLSKMTEEDLNKLLDTMERLNSQNELRVSVGGGAPQGPQQPAELTTQLATQVVEQALFKIGGQMAGAQGGDAGGMLGMITGALGGGDAKGPFTPLTQEQASDGVFDNTSRDLTAQAIMMLKGMNGDKNADGTYDESIGNQLMIGILTKDAFQDIRDQMTMSAEQAALLGIPVPEGQSTTLPIPKMSEEHARELLSGQYDQLTSKFRSEAEFNAYRERIMPLTLMFDSMNKLHQENVLMDNERAKQVNNKNMMLDMAGQMMDQFAPGLKSFLQDFFTNNEFGKMISGVLAVFGINVGRLWGDNDQNAAMERAEPAIAKGFEHFYNNAKDDLTEELSRDPNHQEVMARTSEDMMAKLEGSWAFGKAMDILFKDQDEQVVHDAVQNALAQASAQSSPEASRQAFSQSLIEAGKQFQNGEELDIASINAYLAEAQQEIQATNGNIPNTNEGQPNAGGVVPGNPQQNQGTGNNTGNETNASLNTTSDVLTQASINETTGQPHTRNDDAPVVDADVVEAGDQRVELAFTPNRDEWVQGPLRYSHGRVQDIQEVLGDNAAKLDLSLEADMMKIDGTYSDMMTVNTNAVIEETLIRAQIHKMTEAGEELTQAKLDGLDRTLTPENIEIVTDYMAAKGLSEADIAKFSGAVVGEKANPEDNVRIDGMAVDFFSTNPRDPSAGDKQDHTVMRQSHFGNQFKLSLADWAPQVVPDVDPNADADPLRDRYLEYNKDRPCEVPMFYKNEENGSVMALIRDKNGNDDPSDDTFRELEFDHYLDTHRIQDSDGEDLKALLDNYNWQNPTDEGVRNHINKVLCLDPFNYNHTQEANQPYVATVTEQQQSNDNAGNNRTRNYEDRHPVPETFRDLRKLTEDQADYLSEMMDLESMGGIGNVAERDIKHPLDVMFENAMGNSGYNSGYVLLELEAFGFEHPDFDAVVAMRNGDSIDYRYVDYDTDYIKPLSDQRIGGGDMSAPRNADSGPRRLDDFLDEVDRPVGGNLMFAPSGGYLAMLSIVPSGENGIKSVNAMDAVYGNGASSRYQQDYITNYNRRFNERTAEESLNRASRMYSNENFTGLSEAERRKLDEYAAQQRNSNSPRQGEFNNRSGVEEERRQEQCKPIPQTPGIGAPWINKINRFKNKFGNGDCEEEQPTNSEGRVRENMSDMGVMPEAAEGEILGVYSPQLDNNSGASMGAGR